MLKKPGHDACVPYAGCPRVTWPGGARIACGVTPNIEQHELEPALRDGLGE